jgi:predicted aconitase
MPRPTKETILKNELKEIHRKKVNEREEKLKNISIICPYCSYPSNLLFIKKHMKAKRCQRMKLLFFESPEIKSKCLGEFEINKFINESIYNVSENDNKINVFSPETPVITA